MKKSFSVSIILLLLISGCASSDRMFRMSGGVLDEYSAPKSARIRSEKYQKVSRNFSSDRRANKAEIARLDDTLINIWPFFFRSNEYWSALWPLIDKDPYGFAFRPFYNHEGDDYSILFPLTAWNTAAGHGWVTLFGWNSSGFGIVPLSWQWKEKYSGGWYYTPLFICSYDNTPLVYHTFPGKSNRWAWGQWSRKDKDIFAMLFIYTHKTRVRAGDQNWLFYRGGNWKGLKNEWNYRFKGSKPFPADKDEFERYCRSVYDALPRETEKTYGFFPLWIGEFAGNGNSSNRFLLLAGGSERDGENFKWDAASGVLGAYKYEVFRNYNAVRSRKLFTSWVLLSRFLEEEHYRKTSRFVSFGRLRDLHWRGNFNQQKPAITDELKKFDPALKLPETVVDFTTYGLFLDDIWKKYQFPTDKSRSGGILPFYLYESTPESSGYTIPALLTWYRKNLRSKSSFFGSVPLLTFVSRSPAEHLTTVLTPLSYWEKEVFRHRSDYRVFPESESRVSEYNCTQLKDLYIAGGLFYRGKFGFNVVKAGYDAQKVERLRWLLYSLPAAQKRMEKRRRDIARQRSLNDRWQTSGEIERLKKLIRYEELKISTANLDRDEAEHEKLVSEALKLAGELKFALDKSVLADREKAGKAREKLVEEYSVLRFYEDIGNGLFFRKEKNYNGDHNWHFCHILAGGEKRGDRESTHILHLLYRYRKEGNRSETICFPFISSVKDGDDSRVSFLWRVFSISREKGKTGGYIFFVPFGSKW